MSSPITSRILAWGKATRDADSQTKDTTHEHASLPLSSLTDEELLHRLRAKDEPALSELFDRHARLVFGIAFRVLQDRGEAEEIVQELFLHLIASAHRFDQAKGAARGWISHLAVHKAIDRRGFLKRRRFYDGTGIEMVKDNLKIDEDLETALHRKSLKEQLQQAMEGLSAKQRVTLEWFFFEGISLQEIGGRLGETHFNVRHHFYRGLEKLRKNPIVARLKGEPS